MLKQIKENIDLLVIAIVCAALLLAMAGDIIYHASTSQPNCFPLAMSNPPAMVCK